MEVIIESDRGSADRLAARMIAQLIRRKPEAVLGLATGSTPLGLYRELVRLHREEALDFSAVTTFNLDEYVGLGPQHPASYHRFMQENLFEQLNVRPELVHIPDGLAADVPAFCEEYEARIKAAGGIDFQILGIGSDGHIGFNEPISSLTSRTRIKTLTPRTRSDNARFFASAEEVPHHVITMGIGTIMEAREVLLLGYGQGKADAVASAVEGPVSAQVPASILQFHPQARVLVDGEAASKLQRGDYYRYVYEHKPEWQRPDSRFV
ncbi:MAG: Glucosamine-6-phosphate deaminase [Verrucomicrobiota bacterium]|jgi:glucosamine-6-phosphate deaminase